MFDFFKSLFEKYDFTDSQVDQFLKNFTTVYLAQLVIDAGLSESEQLEINKLSEQSNWDEILKLVKNKFPNDQAWERYSEQIFISLMDDYIKEVIH